jgi:hypothetical protein
MKVLRLEFNKESHTGRDTQDYIRRLEVAVYELSTTPVEVREVVLESLIKDLQKLNLHEKEINIKDL